MRPGIGGDEASLFALDMWTMYRRFAERQGWRFEVLQLTLSEQVRPRTHSCAALKHRGFRADPTAPASQEAQFKCSATL